MMKHLLIAYGVYWMYCKHLEMNQTVRTFPKSKILGDAQSGQHKKRVYYSGVQNLR